MENTLRVTIRIDFNKNAWVLILVLMENTLREFGAYKTIAMSVGS